MNITKPSPNLVRLRQLQGYLFAKTGGFQAPLSERRVLLLVVDSLLVLFGVYLALLGWQAAGRTSAGPPFELIDRWVWFPVLVAGWLGLAWLNDLYHIPSSTLRFKTLTRTITVGFLAVVLYLLIFFFLPPGQLPRRFFLYFIGLTVPLLTLWRWGYGTAFAILPQQHNLLIVGTGRRAQHIKEIVDNTHNLNYHIVGFVTPPVENVPAGNIRLNNVPILGYTPELLDLVLKHKVKEVVLAMDTALDQSLFETLVTCQAFGVSLSNMPDLFEKLEGRIPIEDINPEWTLQIIQNLPVFSRVQLAGKRLFDLVLSIIGLILAAPLMLAIALAIWFTDPSGPVLYSQIRSGRGGRPFKIVKFRSMRPDAEEDGQARWATKGDSRITPIGHFLRKTRLDELPQLFNIINGDMSVVGPRPERPEFIELLEHEVPFYKTRLMVKPGLTGWAQINHEYGNTIEDAVMKLQYDLYYLRHWSLIMDVYIMFRTAGVVLKFKGM